MAYVYTLERVLWAGHEYDDEAKLKPSPNNRDYFNEP